MRSYLAHIERSNRRALDDVEVRMTITDLNAGRRSWSGEFTSRSAEGFLPSERLLLTLDNGQKGTATVSETHFDSRTPEVTLIQFLGSGQLV
jgi:hypothetical protein